MNLVQRQIFGLKKSNFSYLLDEYPSAAIAYSFRKLRSVYSGNCIEVRRSSDNTTSNIGFVDNVLDETSLLAFVGAGDGFIKTWYDQSGNANNLTSASNAAQPRIVLSGVVDKQNGKPSVYSTTSMRLSSGGLTQTYDSAFTVSKIISTNSTVIPFSTAGNSGSYYYGYCVSGGGSNANWGTYSVYKNGNSTAVTNTTGAMYTAFLTGNNRFLLSEFSTVNLTSITRTTQYGTSGGINSEHYIQEHITYTSNKTSDKTGIETNINAYYSIY